MKLRKIEEVVPTERLSKVGELITPSFAKHPHLQSIALKVGSFIKRSAAIMAEWRSVRHHDFPIVMCKDKRFVLISIFAQDH